MSDAQATERKKSLARVTRLVEENWKLNGDVPSEEIEREIALAIRDAREQTQRRRRGVR